jgi:hypothetical protein
MGLLARERWLKAQHSPAVLRALRVRAEKIAEQARQNAEADHVDTDIVITEGVRPRGRPYVRVSSSNVDAEHGTSWTTRSRVLGRAIAGSKTVGKG